MKRSITLTLVAILLCALSTTEIDAQIVEIESRADGFLPPVMSTEERDAIVSPKDGLIIYNESVGRLNYFEAGIGWAELYKGSVIEYFLSLPNGIQTLLDAGETPSNILLAGASTTDFIGLNHAGGIIFYMESNGTGLVAAPENQITGVQWGCFGDDLPAVPNVPDPPSGPGAEIGDGITNTTAILSDCPTAPANFACTSYMGGGFNDWFLPSIKELEEMNMKINSGGFPTAFYWSSSEFDDKDAWALDFPTGNQFRFNKSNSSGFRVRAIRAF